MPKIFLSYRRQDSAGIAGRIYDRLRTHFGDDTVFMDIDSIPFGVDFREHIDAAVGQCDVFLAVIGPRWAGDTDAHRRLDDSRDFVRIELESALKRNLPVIPILIDHARMPGEADLPTSLARLAFRNAIEVDLGRDFHPHVERLIKGIEFHIQLSKSPAASPPSQAHEAAPALPVAQEPKQLRDVGPINAGQQNKPAPPVEPRPDKSSSTTDPGLLPKFPHQTAESSNSTTRAKHTGVVNAQGLLNETPVASRGQEPAASSQFVGAPPKRPNMPWHWLYVPALLLLAFLGAFILGVTIRSAKETPLKGTDIPMQTTTEHGGNKKGASPSPSAANGSKPASSTTHVESPTPAPPLPKTEPPPPRPKREWTNSIGIKLVRIETGEFQMGTTKDQVDQLMRLFPSYKREQYDDEQPAHSVRLGQAFYLGVHEVTQDQHRAVMGDSPSGFNGSDDLPVGNVSWLDAVKFCIKLSEREKRTPFYRIDGFKVTVAGGNGYRLPTEAEWEYACRAKSRTLYPFGDDANELGEFAWFDGNSESKTHPVGQKLPNAWGLYDMLGNLLEWCADGYDEKYYAFSPRADPPGASGASYRVIRGGSWFNAPWLCSPASRFWHRPDYRRGNLGFRLAAVQE